MKPIYFNDMKYKMKEKLVVTSLFTCGILVKSTDVTVLVDGINGDTEYFNGIPEDFYQKLLNREEPFGQIDYLLFTHDHKDHLDGARLTEYAEKNKVKGIFLPLSHTGRDFGLKEALSRKASQPLVIEPSFGAKGHWRFEAGEDREEIGGEDGLTYFSTSHLAPIDRAANHHALLLEIQGKKNLFFRRFGLQDPGAKGKPARYRDRRRVFQSLSSEYAGRKGCYKIHQRKDIILSITCRRRKKDQFSLRKQAVRDQEKYRKDLPGLKLILNAMETCYILV